MTDRQPWILHPFLVGLFPILYLYSRNVHAVPPGATVGPALLVLAVSAALWSGLRWLWRDSAKAGLVVSAAVVLFFGFGRNVRLLGHWRIGRGVEGREWLVMGVELAALAALVWYVRSRPSIARATSAACNAGAVALVVSSMAMAIGRYHTDRSQLPPTPTPRPVPATSARATRRPDIYFLVLDGYGRSDILRELYGFDNSAFLDRLERKGFSVARRSTANYCQTALSLGSTLNLGYHDHLAGSRSQSRLPMRDLVADGAVVRTLRSLGYRTVGFATGFGPTTLDGADLFLAPPRDLGDFHALLLDATPAWFFTGRRGAGESLRHHRDRVLNVFDRLPEVAKLDGPTFCLAHVVAPHPPFVFDADGRDLSSHEKEFTLADGLTWSQMDDHNGPDDYAARYREQVSYITRRAEASIERILADSPEPPIIIVQGDHGPASRFDLNLDRPNDLRERLGILNACYLPGLGPDALPESITPVNTFRLVLDRYFGSNLGPVEDRNFYCSYQSPYLFTEVTGRVESGEVASRARPTR